MIEDNNWKMNEDDEQLQEEPSSRHLLVALEDLLNRSHNSSTFISKIKYQSKSLDDLLIYRRHQQDKNSKISTDNNDNNISNTTRTELDLSGIAYDDDEEEAEEDNEYNLEIQRSRSEPASPTKIYDKEFAAFIECDQQQQQQQSITDNFIYNIDLSDSNETSHTLNSRLAIFFDDDDDDEFLDDEINYEPSVNLLHSSLINNCLTITEENEEELEQLRRDDDEEQQQQQQNFLLKIDENSIPIITLNNDIDIIENETELSDMTKHENNIERLSTIYESSTPQSDIDENTYDKLIVYDIANIDTSTKSSIIHPIPELTISPSLSYRSSIINRTNLGSCYTDASFEPCPNFTNTLTASRLYGTAAMIKSKIYNLTINNNDENLSSSPVINTQFIPKSQSSSRSSPMLFIQDNNNLTASQQSFPHVKKMKVIQSSLSCLSDFISLTPTKNTSKSISLIDENNLLTNKILDDNQERKPSYSKRILTNGLLYSHCLSNPKESLDSTKPISDTSSSSELLSSSDEKLLTRSEFILQQEQNISQQRKASSLKSIFMISPQTLSKILYPIDFQTNNIDISWHPHSHKVPTSDSGIVTDIRPTSKSSIEEDNGTGQLKEYETNYQKTLIDMTIIKKNIVDIDSRLNEVMQELEIEQALIEGEHELVFKQILDASESDQEKIRELYKDLQILIERIMTEKQSLRNEIDYTQQNIFKLEQELYELEQIYRASDEKILQKKEIIATTRKKYEDLEFQLMELETRCESELEQAEEHFQHEQKYVTQNSKIRQNTLRELDHQQYMILHQATMEKEKLEREKQKLKLLFKQKKIKVNELEQNIHGISETWNNRAIYHSTPINLYSLSNYTDNISTPRMKRKDDHQDKLNEIKEMIAKVKLEKMSILEQQLRERYNENIKRIEFEQKVSDEIQNHDYEVKLREKNRTQERPLTRYLPIRSADFDLRAHIEGAGHQLDSPHISLTSTSCRGYLYKMGGIKFKTWNRRWFVFDRQCHSLFYYQDKNEIKLRGCINFQSILEVYIDHLQSISLRSPEPRQATFIVKTNQRSYYLVAPTIELMRIWIDVIITGAEGNTFAEN